eukprot:4245295-Karenia_brevis.AAC.1
MKIDFVGGGSTEITVDRGVEEFGYPWEWGQHFGCRRVGEPMRLRNASGRSNPHWGTRAVQVVSTFGGLGQKGCLQVH